MKKIGLSLLCLVLLFGLIGCNGHSSDTSSSQSSTSSQDKLSKDEYQSLSSVFQSQYQNLMEQLQIMLTSYAGNDQWYNDFDSLYQQAKQAESKFAENKDRVPDECVEDYNTLMSIVSGYDQAMTKAQEAKNLSGVQQQQTLNEAGQLLMQANNQWTQTQTVE